MKHLKLLLIIFYFCAFSSFSSI